MDTKELETTIERLHKEVITWRECFLKDRFDGEYRYISTKHKNKLQSYFLSIPSHSFTKPFKEWDICIGALLQDIAKEENAKC
jgi:hypothetical protein